MHSSSLLKRRLIGLDVFKGWAIVFMMVFHITFDLNYFHFISVAVHKEIFWVNFRYLIVAMFLVSVGISLTLVHSPKILWSKMFKRTRILGAVSLVITVATYFVFPHSWVYFGIIHFILLASWLGLPFLPYPRLTLGTAIVILIGSAKGWLHTQWLFALLKTPLHLPPTYTEDVLHPFPWFAAVLIGIAMTQHGWSYTFFKHTFWTSKNKFNTLLSFLGRHALLVYLIHLPLFFGLCMLIYKMK